MRTTPTVVILRDLPTDGFLLWNMAPDRSRPYVSVMIEEVEYTADEFRTKAWDLVSRSLDTFTNRTIDRPQTKSQEEVRRVFRRERELQRRCLYLGVEREDEESMLLHLSKGKKGHWDEIGRMKMGIPSSNADFVAALVRIGFLGETVMA